MLRNRLIQRSTGSFLADGASAVNIQLVIWHQFLIVVEAVIESRFLSLLSFINHGPEFRTRPQLAHLRATSDKRSISWLEGIAWYISVLYLSENVRCL